MSCPVIQIVLNGLIAASIYVLVGIGFLLIHNTARFLNFAHGSLVTLGAYFAFLFHASVGLPLPVACLLGIACCSLVGATMEIAVYCPLRRRGSSPLVLLISSLGLYLIFENLISLSFGDHIKTIGTGSVVLGVDILGARVTPIQLLTLLASSVLSILVFVMMRATRTGRAMRAVADHPDLAMVCGINADRSILLAFVIGSGLAGTAGLLLALDVGMTPTMGLGVLIMGVVAVVIGGLGSAPGLVCGALLLGLAQHFAAWTLSSQWADAVAFVILVAFLVVRPQGFFGKRIRKAEV